MHFLAHRTDLFRESIALPWQRQHCAPDGLESLADGRIARGEARAGERLVFPDPGGLALIALKTFDRGNEQPCAPVGPQAQIGIKQQTRGGARREPT